jgi:hypothetical protein
MVGCNNLANLAARAGQSQLPLQSDLYISHLRIFPLFLLTRGAGAMAIVHVIAAWLRQPVPIEGWRAKVPGHCSARLVAAGSLLTAGRGGKATTHNERHGRGRACIPDEHSLTRRQLWCAARLSHASACTVGPGSHGARALRPGSRAGQSWPHAARLVRLARGQLPRERRGSRTGGALATDARSLAKTAPGDMPSTSSTLWRAEVPRPSASCPRRTPVGVGGRGRAVGLSAGRPGQAGRMGTPRSLLSCWRRTTPAGARPASVPPGLSFLPPASGSAPKLTQHPPQELHQLGAHVSRCRRRLDLYAHGVGRHAQHARRAPTVVHLQNDLYGWHMCVWGCCCCCCWWWWGDVAAQRSAACRACVRGSSAPSTACGRRWGRRALPCMLCYVWCDVHAVLCWALGSGHRSG